MFDIGMTEMLVVGVVALIVVGPKDLPVMFRRVGQFVGKAKGMAREFSSAMNDAADQTGVRDMAGDLNKSLKAATNPVGAAMDGVKDAASSLTNFDAESETGQLAAQRADERANASAQIEANSARMAAERKAREAKEALAKAEELEASLAARQAAKKADT